MNSHDESILFECTKCGACCREESLLVTVTGRDLARISTILGLDASELIRAVDFYLVSGITSYDGLRDFPALNTEKGPAYVALKKMENGDCVFLKDNLCMIHTIRPVVCMSFPFVFQDAGDHRKWGLSAMKHICPGLGSGPEVIGSELIELADTVLENLVLFKEFGVEWNTISEPSVQKLIEAILSDPRFSV
ncbi:MAG: YkgJ family cysteine cluster protein [Candidatus Thorarchaeota archaeon]